MGEVGEEVLQLALAHGLDPHRREGVDDGVPGRRVKVRHGMESLPRSEVGTLCGGPEGGDREAREAGVDAHGQGDAVLRRRGGREAEGADSLREVPDTERDQTGPLQSYTQSGKVPVSRVT